MGKLILQPTITAHWQALVQEAESSGHINIGEELESYLVFLLERFTSKPEIVKSVLGLEFLQGASDLGLKQQDELREVGDKCLLFAGFFPGRAERKRVRISYFVKLGQTAYAILSSHSKQKVSELYKALGIEFVPLMDILHLVRRIANDTNSLTPLQAQELWEDTSSQYALKELNRYSTGHSFIFMNLGKSKH